MTISENIYNALRDFAEEVTEKSSGTVVGESEDQLRAPFEALMRSVGTELGREIVCVGETLLQNRIGKPDFGVISGRLLSGYAELKAPGKGVERRRFVGHDREQFDRFAQLPNVLYTDGNDWALYRFGEREGRIVRMHGDVTTDGQNAVTVQSASELFRLLADFIDWQPIIPIDSQGRVNLPEFAKQLAPLCKFLRDDVREAMSDDESPLNSIAERWREMLFPNASDEQFADAYAQTVTFALLLARIQGAGSEADRHLTFDNARLTLREGHSLLSASLGALADDEMQNELSAGLNALLRTFDAVPAGALSGDVDPWLYFYEPFLAVYDAKLRKNAGVYYTPVEVVHAQVRLVDDLLMNRFGKSQGFADASVVTLDPATGTGTYLLGVIEHSLQGIADQYGRGAVAGHARQLASNLHGFELMVGPYAVTDLRVTETLREYNPELSDVGAQIYLTDTLESPERRPPQGGFFIERELAHQQESALRVKKDVDVLVCIGNPPYDRAAAIDASGGWVRHGEDDTDDRPILNDFIEPAQVAGHGVHLKNLYNLYVYFWRWALWKVFEQDASMGPGVVSFISASSYLYGDAFAGMREHMRRLCDEIWILDIGGEARGPRKSENVFDIQTPVAIAVACRTQDKNSKEPAKVRFARIKGTRTEKLAALDEVSNFSQVNWQDCPDDWQAPFLPAGTGDYFDWPLLTDLMPWHQSGVKAGRTWVIAPATTTLNERWKLLLQSRRDERPTLFKNSPTGRKAHEVATQLPPSNERLQSIINLSEESPSPETVRFTYRTLDRQFILGDSRLLDRPGPTLWRAHSDIQVYLMSLFSTPIASGPAITTSALLPDLDNFRGSYGSKSVIPLYRTADASETNIVAGLLPMLANNYGYEISPQDFIAYLYGIMAHPAYTKRYYKELATRQVRLPLTKDSELFDKVRDVGARLLWLHTYGERFIPDGFQRGQIPQGEARCISAVPTNEDKFPTSFLYDADSNTLHVGEGIFAPVSPEVFEFQVSGLKVAQSWLKYRMRDGAGRKSSPLDDIRPTTWPINFTTELLELLWVLESTVAVQPEQAQLLAAVDSGEWFEADELPEVPDYLRKPPPRPTASSRLV